MGCCIITAFLAGEIDRSARPQFCCYPNTLTRFFIAESLQGAAGVGERSTATEANGWPSTRHNSRRGAPPRSSRALHSRTVSSDAGEAPVASWKATVRGFVLEPHPQSNVTAERTHRGCRQNAFWRATDADVEVNAGVGQRWRDGGADISVARTNSNSNAGTLRATRHQP